MTENENRIKIKGSANIVNPLELGREYDITASCTCTDEKIVDNQDGSIDHIYSLKLVGNVNIISSKEIIKAEVKKSSMSACLRFWIRDWWISEGSIGELDLFYKEKMQEIIDGVKEHLN
jgi:hypothetical protein